MTSAQRGRGVRKYPNFADKQYIKLGQRREGVKKSQKISDVIYGSPLGGEKGVIVCANGRPGQSPSALVP